MKKRKISLSTTHIILLSFLGAILLGSLLLSLPISSKTSEPVPYVDALFTATTSTCVTGLVTLPTVTTWSTFGQVVILLLIQVGGLGIITFLSGFMLLMKRKFSVNNHLLIQDAFNLNTMSGLSKFIRKVIFGTFIVELTGALLYMTVFIPDFGPRGIWISVFNSISAFCNAGIDIFSETSLSAYATNPLVNFVTSALIIMGGIGYIVWWDIPRVLKKAKTQGFKCIRHLSLHSKLAISSTAVLLILGTILFLTFEYNNPLTLKNYSLFDKIQISFFQSVTTRTAGFFTVAQENLTASSAVVSLILMFIGGSPVGTAGGIKTVTILVLLASSLSTVKGRDEVTLFRRNISKEALSKAVAVFTMSFIIMITSTLLLTIVCDAPFVDILYETVSATATVGLSRNLTPSLNTLGKIIIIVTMYLGRIGPISLALALKLTSKNENIVKNPTEKISVG